MISKIQSAPPTTINSFRDKPVDKTGLTRQELLPRPNQTLKTEAAQNPARGVTPDKIEISAEAQNRLATPSAVKLPAAPPAETAKPEIASGKKRLPLEGLLV